MDGYAGSILYVDLTKGSAQKKPLPEELKKQYLGGRGFGVKLVSDLVPPKADPLGEKNVIVFATGPLYRDRGPTRRASPGGFKIPAEQYPLFL